MTVRVATNGGEEDLGPIHWDGAKWVDAEGHDAFVFAKRHSAACETDGGTVTLPDSAYFRDFTLSKTDGGDLMLEAAAGCLLDVSGLFTLGGTANYTIGMSAKFGNSPFELASANSSLTFEKDAVFGGTILIDNGATMTFNGDSTFDKTVLISNGVLTVSGNVSGSGKIVEATVYGNTNRKLCVNGASVNVPIDIGNKSAQGTFVIAGVGTAKTNYFHGKVSDKGSTALYLGPGYTYVFDSGVGALIYQQDSDDLMPLVKKKLKL